MAKILYLTLKVRSCRGMARRRMYSVFEKYRTMCILLVLFGTRTDLSGKYPLPNLQRVRCSCLFSFSPPTPPCPAFRLAVFVCFAAKSVARQPRQRRKRPFPVQMRVGPKAHSGGPSLLYPRHQRKLGRCLWSKQGCFCTGSSGWTHLRYFIFSTSRYL